VQRRVYDALNVLSALDVIDKDRNKISFKGFDALINNTITSSKTKAIARRENSNGGLTSDSVNTLMKYNNIEYNGEFIDEFQRYDSVKLFC
jgi:hypothetical protein